MEANHTAKCPKQRIAGSFQVRAAIGFLVVGTLLRHSPAEVYLQGRVVDNLNSPVPGAVVSLDGSLSDTTDGQGLFYFGFVPMGVEDPRNLRQAPPLAFAGSRVTVRETYGKRLSVLLFDGLGRSQTLLRPATVHSHDYTVDLGGTGEIPSGVYVLHLRVGNRVTNTRCIVSGRQYLWQSPLTSREAESAPGALAKRFATHSLSTSAGGYATRSLNVDSDTAIGLLITLFPSSIQPPAQVTATVTTETRRFKVPDHTGGTSRYAWANNSGLQSYMNLDYQSTLTADKTFTVVHLDNGLVRVTVAPDLGMRIIRARDLTRVPEREMFTAITNPVNPTPFAQNIGGIKPSFPYHENSTGMIDENGELNCKAGYYIESNIDGSVSVIMNLRFDYHQTERDAGFTGKYGDRSLNGVVTVRPGRSDFEVSYIAENPNPLRRSDRIWTVAAYEDRELNVLDGLWVYPTKYAVQHCATELYDIQANGLEPNETGSYFALFPQYGFIAMYNAGANANHVRVTDPTRYPAAKLYHKTPFELWGSNNALFECPAGFVNAFEPNRIVHRYYMAREIGEVTFANEHVAVGVSGSTFRLTTPGPSVVTIYNYNQNANPILSDQAVGPTTVLTGTFSQGLRVVSNGRELCNVAIPLVYADNGARWNELKTCAELSGCAGLSTLDGRYGYHYELEHIQGATGMLSSLAALLASDNVSSSDDPDILMSIANACYRQGAFDETEATLLKTGTQRPAETAYLRGLMNLERGQAADFSNATIEGNYFKALLHVQQGATTEAVAALDQLLDVRPNAVRPRLLRAYLANDVQDALYVYLLVPGSIELWTVLIELGYSGAAERLASLLQQDQSATVCRDNFLAELRNGQWTHERRFEYDRGWYENVSLPAFPDFLRYQ